MNKKNNKKLILNQNLKLNDIDCDNNNFKFLDERNLERKSPLIIALEKNLNFEIIEFLSSKFIRNDILKFDFDVGKLDQIVLLKKYNEKKDFFEWRLSYYLIWKKKTGFISYLRSLIIN